MKPRLDGCTRERLGMAPGDHGWCRDCYPGNTLDSGSLEAMRAAEGNDPMLIALRMLRYPNSGTTLDAHALAKAVLGPSQSRMGLDVKKIDDVIYILVFGGQLTEHTVGRLESFLSKTVVLLEAEPY